ncbi:hypothetical protein CC86DRAFT_407552 [Ophiobolus disseminans]|uniref:Uncharacterized protein n=1 Tax=Ophiobolus disseminans TaxID=1469910 RepID=A0A6A6ZYE3_9PLEO|nr:hypothetical protein CC86DRAFT_407552 [Ophiobolus disseminans]
MSSQTQMKKSKGMKDHKKAQKEKAIAKRAAAAEKAKQKNTVKIEKKVEPAELEKLACERFAQLAASSPIEGVTEELVDGTAILVSTVDARDETFLVQDITPAVDLVLNHGTPESATKTPMVDRHDSFRSECVIEDVTAAEQKMSHKIVFEEFSAMHASPPSPCDAPRRPDMEPVHHALVVEPTSDAAPFDIHAHRKALEDALYDNMESPSTRHARLTHTSSADAEFNANQDPYDYLTPESIFEVDSHTIKRATDSNGFDVVAVCTPSLVDEEPGTIGDDAPQACEQEDDKSFCPAVAQLFAAADSEHELVVELPAEASDDASQVYQQEGDKSFCPSVAQLFAAATSEAELVVELPAEAGDETTRRARKLMFIEADMTFGCEDQYSAGPLYADPAIVSCKVAEVQPYADPAIVNCKIRGRGVACSAPITSTAHQEGAEKIMSLLGVNLSRTVSQETDVYSHASSTPCIDRSHTPFTHYSASPPPIGGQYGGYGQEYYNPLVGYDSRWLPSPMTASSGPCYGSAPPPFMSEYAGQHMNYDFVPGQHVYHNSVPGQPFWYEQIPHHPFHDSTDRYRQNTPHCPTSFQEFIPGQNYHGTNRWPEAQVSYAHQ